MLTTTHNTLRVLAAVVWYIGASVLLLKGSSLLREADELQPDTIWPLAAAAAGVVVGAVKGLLLFTKSCHKNLDRIACLQQPKPWQFFSVKFLLALALMITAGATMSRMAHGNFAFLIAVAILDFGVGTALLLSSYVFWKRRKKLEDPPRP